MLKGSLSWPLDAAQELQLSRTFYDNCKGPDALDPFPKAASEDVLVVEAPVPFCAPELTLDVDRNVGPVLCITTLSNARNVEVYTKEGDYCGTALRVSPIPDARGLCGHVLRLTEQVSRSHVYVLRFLLPKGNRDRFCLSIIEVSAPPAPPLLRSPLPAPPLAGLGGLDMSAVRQMVASLDVEVSSAAMQLLSNVEMQQQRQHTASAALISAAGNAAVSETFANQLPNERAAPKLDGHTAGLVLKQVDSKIDALKRHFDARLDKLENTLASLVEILSQEHD
ncbi:hypothetical protein HDU86_008494 [Geranomyces michiganensis]|nr:hypothetical protein HDU86_008494 [Geranomyces michiganensis]